MARVSLMPTESSSGPARDALSPPPPEGHPRVFPELGILRNKGTGRENGIDGSAFLGCVQLGLIVL